MEWDGTIDREAKFGEMLVLEEEEEEEDYYSSSEDEEEGDDDAYINKKRSRSEMEMEEDESGLTTPIMSEGTSSVISSISGLDTPSSITGQGDEDEMIDLRKKDSKDHIGRSLYQVLPSSSSSSTNQVLLG